MPSSIPGTVTMQGLPYCEEVTKNVRSHREALRIDRFEPKTIDKLDLIQNYGQMFRCIDLLLEGSTSKLLSLCSKEYISYEGND